MTRIERIHDDLFQFLSLTIRSIRGIRVPLIDPSFHLKYEDC